MRHGREGMASQSSMSMGEILHPGARFHANLTTTLRYMHLSPSARATAIGLLNDRREFGQIFGEILETGPSPTTREPLSR
jgi:hypothetical protein